MYKQDLALNNPQEWVWHKTQPTNLYLHTISIFVFSWVLSILVYIIEWLILMVLLLSTNNKDSISLFRCLLLAMSLLSYQWFLQFSSWNSDTTAFLSIFSFLFGSFQLYYWFYLLQLTFHDSCLCCSQFF